MTLPLDPTVTNTGSRRGRGGGKDLETDIEEGVKEGEYASAVTFTRPAAKVTLAVGSGEEWTKALGTVSDVQVVATEPHPVIGASHEGRTAVVKTGVRGRVSVKPVEETRVNPRSSVTHKPRIPKRTGLTPKPPKPPSTATPKPRGRKGRAAFTASMRMRK